MPGIVVGVDGSAHSRYALNFALDEADLRGVALTVLTVSPISSGIYGPGYAPAPYPADEQIREQAEKAAQELLSEVVAARGRGPATKVTVTAVSGLAADEMIFASYKADMVVVGARGVGGFARLVMGSVSAQVTQHARCPVVVVPGDRDAS
ncbi:MAG TPA: universal stress protein [Streptosporangiaceae bacterium]|jgi:nucleotide-binding universal stress UspA family protein|nr:universal stress protein [Streptosporangiaceae bacterium]